MGLEDPDTYWGSRDVKAPWEAYRGVHRRSIGWRDGEPAAYYQRFCQTFSTMSAAEQSAYVEAHPEPEDWRGFYAMVQAGRWE